MGKPQNVSGMFVCFLYQHCTLGQGFIKLSALPSLHGRGIKRPNKQISVSRVMGLKILGRVGTHIFFDWNFMHFERHFAFQNA